MPMEGMTECAVRGCSNHLSGTSNLCTVHQLPGCVVSNGASRMVITCWLARRGVEQGLILLNDFALGDLFDGADGFVGRLRQQGFTDIRNLKTVEEFDAARRMRLAHWSGPWETSYPWEGDTFRRDLDWLWRDGGR